jgi:hypothetical protein
VYWNIDVYQGAFRQFVNLESCKASHQHRFNFWCNPFNQLGSRVPDLVNKLLALNASHHTKH